MNLHVGRSSVVHTVVWADWIDDLVLPAPACRQGFAGHGALYLDGDAPKEK